MFFKVTFLSNKMGLFSLFTKSDVLYFPGCMLYLNHKENFELYKKIFNKLGIPFRILDKNFCCGIEVLEAGYEQEARRIAKENFQSFKEEGIKEIITSSPECYKAFRVDYPVLIPDFNIKIINMWQIILDRLNKKQNLIKYKSMEKITFHDNCYLGRYCKIYDEPRKILHTLGYEIKEMTNNQENSFCCGSCGGLPRIDQELANKLAKERILQAKRIGMKKMIVCSMENYDLLSKNYKNLGVEILELSEILCIALGIKKKEIINEEETKEEILENIEILKEEL